MLRTLDPLKAPGEVPPGKAEEYRKIASRLAKALPTAPPETVRTLAVDELCRQLDARQGSPGLFA